MSTQDSNATGARITEEQSPRVLPGSPVWYPMEPNSYSDFGGSISKVARNPINPTRQLRKGSTVDLEASGGFNQDFTETGLLRLMQGFVFADALERADTRPLNGAPIVISSVDNVGNEYVVAAGGTAFSANDLIFASGFSGAASNGLKTVVAADATTIEVDEGVGATGVAPASARLQKVGKIGAAGDLVIVMDGTVATMTSTLLDFLDEGITEGEWLYLDGFTAAGNNCFVRVDAVDENEIRFGKTTRQMVNESPVGQVRIFMGKTVRNASDPLDIVKRSYQIERTLGHDGNGTMSEYLVGAVANEFTLNVEEASLMTADLSFVAEDHETRTGSVGVKSGTRPMLTTEDAYNTSSDVRRLMVSIVDPAVSFSPSLFAFAQQLTIELTNNVSPNKAIGVLGAFSMTAGKFEVSGSSTVYFQDVAALAAIRDNSDVTVDMIVVKNNGGWVFDIPLVSLGDGRLNVEEDSPITLPLETNAAESHLGYTLSLTRFNYLPATA